MRLELGQHLRHHAGLGHSHLLLWRHQEHFLLSRNHGRGGQQAGAGDAARHLLGFCQFLVGGGGGGGPRGLTTTLLSGPHLQQEFNQLTINPTFHLPRLAAGKVRGFHKES